MEQAEGVAGGCGNDGGAGWEPPDSDRPALPDPDRPALPAGDPLAWSVLVAGTCLDGAPWPGWGRSGWDAPMVEAAP